MSTVLSNHWSEALYRASDRAISHEAGTSRHLRRFLRNTTPSVSIDQAYQECLSSLGDAFEEASRRNWDGYGAEPVSDATVARALTFLDLLPTAVPRPDISPHPDGELAFEWFLGPRRLLTVSIDESGRLSFAAIFGQARLHGVDFFFDTLPEPIALALRRLYARE